VNTLAPSGAALLFTRRESFLSGVPAHADF